MYKFIILSLLLFSTCFGLEQLISDSLETMSAEITAAPTDSTSGDSCVILKNGVVTIVPKDIFADSLNISVDSVSYADTAGYATYADSADYLFVGKVWESHSPDSIKNWRSITFGNNLFVAVAGAGNIITSPDGVNWTDRIPPSYRLWNDACYGNGLFVIVADLASGNNVSTSHNGIIWTEQTTPAFNGVKAVCYGNGTFVAVASDGDVMSSPNGVSWTEQTEAASNYWRDVCFGDTIFLAVSSNGSGNRVMTSPDGETWTSQSSSSDLSWYSVTYGNGLFVAVAYGIDSVMTSPDGAAWTTRAAVSGAWYSVTYGNGLFVAVELSGGVMTSPDGINWVSRSGAESNQWYSVTYGNGMFVSVASTGTNRIMTSGAHELNTPSHNNIYQGGMEINGDVLLPDLSPGKVVTTGTDTVLATPDSAGIDSLTTNNFSIGSGPYITKVDTNSTNDTLWHIFGSDTFYMVKKP